MAVGSMRIKNRLNSQANEDNGNWVRPTRNAVRRARIGKKYFIKSLKLSLTLRATAAYQDTLANGRKCQRGTQAAQW